MMTIIRAHVDGGATDTLHVVPEEYAARWAAAVVSSPGSPGTWAAVPPAGSEWEAAEWDALAHRAGVA